MAIDRIGKGGAPGGPGGASLPREVGPTEKAERPFEVTRAEAPDVQKTSDAQKISDAQKTGGAQKVDAGSSVAAAGPLAKLRAGEIDVHKYLDLKVDEATKHLHGLPPAEMDAVKKMLRDQLATDPGLSDLVTQATGTAPPPVDD